jgi:hypothetical protein
MDEKSNKIKTFLVFAVSQDGGVVLFRKDIAGKWTVPVLDLSSDADIVEVISGALENDLGLVDAKFETSVSKVCVSTKFPKYLRDSLGPIKVELETPSSCVVIARDWAVFDAGNRTVKSLITMYPEYLLNFKEIDSVVKEVLWEFFKKQCSR